MQQWLEQFPEDTVIEVGVQERPEPYQSFGAVIFVEFVGDYGQHELIDFRNNSSVKEGHQYYGKVYLQLGSSV